MASETQRNYRRLVASSGLSNLADGVFMVALPLVALGITRDPTAFASVTVVGRLPWLLFALPAGALADRLDRRQTMTLVNAARVVVIGGLAAIVAPGWEELWILYVAAFALGIGETLFDTAAQSILPNIVSDPEGLSRANGRLYAVEMTANQFVGPPVGGLIAAASLAGAMALSAGAYFLAAGMLLLLVGHFRPVRTGAPTTIRTDVREGLKYLLGHRVLRTMAIIVGVSNLAFTAIFSVFPLYAVSPGPVGLDAGGFGLLLTAGAVGSLIASSVVERIERRIGRFRALLLAVLAFPVLASVPAFTASVWIIAAAFVLEGVANVVWNVITVSLRQRITPDHLMGRVNAGYRLLAWGTMPIGAALGGILADTFGLRTTFALMAGVNLLIIPLLLANVRPADLVESEPELASA